MSITILSCFWRQDASFPFGHMKHVLHLFVSGARKYEISSHEAVNVLMASSFSFWRQKVLLSYCDMEQILYLLFLAPENIYEILPPEDVNVFKAFSLSFWCQKVLLTSCHMKQVFYFFCF